MEFLDKYLLTLEKKNPWEGLGKGVEFCEVLQPLLRIFEWKELRGSAIEGYESQTGKGERCILFGDSPCK